MDASRNLAGGIHFIFAWIHRIIYVVPYTSIIEQTADVFREILGADQVLEHHSGVLYETGDHATAESISMAQATENWDIPVVVTTAVQFFESLYSNRPAACRKLHHLAKSVIVMDEAQMLPVDQVAIVHVSVPHTDWAIAPPSYIARTPVAYYTTGAISYLFPSKNLRQMR